MIGEQHKRINLERRHGPARVDRPAEQRPSPVLTKESCAAIGYERKEKRAAGSQGTAIVRHVRYNYRNDANASRDGPQEYLRTLQGSPASHRENLTPTPYDFPTKTPDPLELSVLRVTVRPILTKIGHAFAIAAMSGYC